MRTRRASTTAVRTSVPLGPSHPLVGRSTALATTLVTLMLTYGRLEIAPHQAVWFDRIFA